MQATLLSIGIAIIVALLAAIFGPHFVDWSAYRPVFEQRAGAAIGVPVRISGRIDARLLPTPAVTLNDVATAEPQPRLRAQAVSLELALGALLRGQWRITELTIRAPEVVLGIDSGGRIDWPGAGPGFDPESLSIERVQLENGRLRLAHAASDAAVTLDRVAFRGDMRSLAGPIKGEGEFVIAKEQYGFRLTTGRRGDDGGVRARLALTRAGAPVAAEADGMLRVDDDGPKFEGPVSLSRAAGVELVEGRARQAEAWRIAGRVKANARQALFEQVELQYGSDERALKLAGAAELKLAGRPRLDAVLSARQLDIDQFASAEPRPAPLVQLAGLLAQLREALGAPLPFRLGVAVDLVTIGGAPLQNVQLDAALADDRLSIDRFELRGPGASNLRTSGTLRISPEFGFAGRVVVDAQDPRALAAWLEGQPGPAAQVAPMRANGDVVFGADRLAVERLSAQIDGKPVTGRVSYAAPAGAQSRLEAELRAPDLDLDAAYAFFRAALPEASLKRPAELSLVLDLERAAFAGVEARGLSAKLVSDASRLSVERLRIDDLAGASVDLSGNVRDPWTQPRGDAKVAMASTRADGLADALAGYAPAWAKALRAAAAGGGLRLEGTLSATEANAATRTTARLSGSLGAMRVALDGEAVGEPSAWRNAQLRIDARADAADGAKLMAMLSGDRFGLAQPGPAALELRAQGAVGQAMRVEGRIGGAGLTIAGDGSARLTADGEWTADLNASLAADDLAALRRLLGSPDRSAPATLRARVSLTPDAVRVGDLAGALVGAPVKGNLSLSRTTPPTVEGGVEVDTLDLTALAALLSGSGDPPAAGWPSTAFTPLGRQIAGRLDLAAARALVGPATIHRFRTTLRVRDGEAAIDNAEGTLGGGRFAGGLALQGEVGSLAATLHVKLTSVELSEIARADTLGATGRMNLSLDLKGAGRSAATLLATLGGAGDLAIDNLQLARLSPNAFDAALRAADSGQPIEPGAIRKVVETSLDAGRLRLSRATAAIAATAGQLRLSASAQRGDGADLVASGSVDLVAGQIDARLGLLGPSAIEAAGRPEIGVGVKGALDAPHRTVDVSALVAWLTLRSVELHAKRLEALEAERRAAEARAAARESGREPAPVERPAPRAAPAPPEAQAPSVVPPVAPTPPGTRARPPTPTAIVPQDGSPRIDMSPAARTTAAPPAPRRAAPPPQGAPTQAEAAPPLPPPVDIRPAPGARRPTANAQPAPPQRPAEPRSFLEKIFGR